MNDALIHWLKEESWMGYPIDTQLFGLQSDSSIASTDKGIGLIIDRLKNPNVGLAAFQAQKISYTSTGNAFWDLFFLADIGLTAKNIGISEEVEKVLEMQSEDGSFVLQEGVKPSYYCITSIVLSSLVKMGYQDDSRIEKFLQLVLDTQRLDGGWHCAVNRATGKKLQNTDSCPMDILNILMLLGQYERFQTEARFNGAIDLLLEHWKRRVDLWRPYGFGIGSDFKKLKYPAVKYGILRVLDALSYFPYATNSREFADMLQCVLDKSFQGKYYAESVSRSFVDFDFGQTKEPSRWLTFLVNRIQKRAGV